MTQPLFCPQCGQPLDQQQQTFRLHNGRAIVTLLTCRNAACEARGRTASKLCILDPEQLQAWGFIPKFDLNTGEKLSEVCLA